MPVFDNSGMYKAINRAMPPAPVRPYGPRGAFAVQKGRMSVVDAARNALRGLAYGMASDPTNLEVGPATGLADAVSFALPALYKNKALEKGLVTRLGGRLLRDTVLFGEEPMRTRSIMIRDPNLPAKLAEANPGMAASALKDLHSEVGGTRAARVDYSPRSRASSKSNSLMKYSAGIDAPLPRDYPVYHVDLAESVGKGGGSAFGDPEGVLDPIHGGWAMEQLVKKVGREHPGKIVAIEADLANADLMDLAENMGLYDPSITGDNHAVFFARDDKLIPVSRVVRDVGERQLGMSPEQIDWNVRLVKDQRRKLRADRAAERRAVREMQNPEHGYYRENVPDVDMDEPIGMSDVPPGDFTDASYREALDRYADQMLFPKRVADPMETAVGKKELDQVLSGLKNEPWNPTEVKEVAEQFAEKEKRYPTREEIELLMKGRGYYGY